LWLSARLIRLFDCTSTRLRSVILSPTLLTFNSFRPLYAILGEKLLSFGQFRKPDSIDPMLNAWAIVNNLRAFLPDAKKAGQSLAQFFGAQLHGLPWMEALNLSTVV
ncbi:hypothetical protein, partial [Leptolyngbya sp. BC1307]|uniref:hypothetical protein n=1 Tax=Leptolyngbya sp. BC1307 TaxID=2029589 RepID=UPI001982306F